MNLDGVDDYVNLGNPPALQLTGQHDAQRLGQLGGFPADDAAIVSKRGHRVGFQLDTTITGPRTIGFKLTSSSGGNMFRYGATTLQPNTWYHVAGVYDAAAQTWASTSTACSTTAPWSARSPRRSRIRRRT